MCTKEYRYRWKIFALFSSDLHLTAELRFQKQSQGGRQSQRHPRRPDSNCLRKHRPPAVIVPSGEYKSSITPVGTNTTKLLRPYTVL